VEENEFEVRQSTLTNREINIVVREREKERWRVLTEKRARATLAELLAVLLVPLEVNRRRLVAAHSKNTRAVERGGTRARVRQRIK
jgi:hypothetical protein